MSSFNNVLATEIKSARMLLGSRFKEKSDMWAVIVQVQKIFLKTLASSHGQQFDGNQDVADDKEFCERKMVSHTRQL